MWRRTSFHSVHIFKGCFAIGHNFPTDNCEGPCIGFFRESGLLGINGFGAHPLEGEKALTQEKPGRL